MDFLINTLYPRENYHLLFVEPKMQSISTSPAKKKGRTESTVAVGVTEYKKLVAKSTIFIDKSLLIKEFLQSTSETILITCPRRWGKSINLDMIKTFLEIQLDEHGNKYEDRKVTSHYKLFVEGVVDFEGGTTTTLEVNNGEKLLISEESDVINGYQGQYPVIFVDFKNVKGNNYEQILNEVKAVLHNTFMQHEKLYKVFLQKEIQDHNEINGTNYPIEGKDIKFLTKIIDSKNILLSDYVTRFKRFYDNNGQGTTDIDITHGLQFLSKILNKHFGKRPYVFMDEYDAPINNVLRNKEFTESDLDKTLLLFRSIMGTVFKGNEHLEKGLITGVFRIAKASIFSDLNNITEYNFLNNEFAKYYGFSQSEVDGLFEEYRILPELSKRAKNWYDGYRVIIEKDLIIYNPWSIVKFLDTYKNYKSEEKHLAIQNYWEESGSIDFITSLFKVEIIRNDIQSLINREKVSVDLQKLKFTKENFLTLKDLMNKGDNYEVEYPVKDLLFSYIFAAGYLTISSNSGYGETITSIRLPNNEVAFELSQKLISYYKLVYKIDTKLFKNVTDKLKDLFKADDTSGLKRALEELFKKFPPFINIKEPTVEEGVHGNEDLIHSVINYIGLQLSGLSKFGSEVWYKKQGRADVVLIDDGIKTGMIIEVKYAGQVDEALKQAKTYEPILEKYANIESIIYVGVSVTREKDVDIKYELCRNPGYDAPSTNIDNTSLVAQTPGPSESR